MKSLKTAKAIRIERASSAALAVIQKIFGRSIDRHPLGFCTPSSRCRRPDRDLVFLPMGESEAVVMIVSCYSCGGSFRRTC